MMRRRLLTQQPGWLALMLVGVVLVMCLSQRMGLVGACIYAAPSDISQPLTDLTLTDPSLKANSSQDEQEEHSSCSLSEQLLMKVWHQLDPILLGLLLLVALWLMPPLLSGYGRQLPPLFTYLGRRRHLVLCVFRE